MEPIIRTVPDLIELAKRIKTATDIITVDTETNGLFPIEDKVVGWSLAFSADEGYYVPTNHRNSPNVPHEQVRQLFQLLSQKKLVWHNSVFDLEMIKTNYGIEMPVYSDTIIMAYLACYPELGLKKIMSTLFNYETKEFTDLLAEKFGSTWKAQGKTAADLDPEEIYEYAINDVLYTRRLFDLLKSDMDKYRSIFKLELNLAPIVAKMNLSGITIDSPKLTALATEANAELATRLNKMQEIVNQEVAKFNATHDINALSMDPNGGADLIKRVGDLSTFKPNSVKQIKTILFDLLNQLVIKRTEKGEPSTDAEVLEKYAEDGCEFALELKNYRSLSKIITSYLEKIPEICSHTGKLYANFKSVGTDSGRFKSDGVKNWAFEDRTVNLQNQPRDDDQFNVRMSYVAPEGYTWVKCDYKQQEYRAMCNIAGETTAIEKFKAGIDFHTATARFMFDIPDDQEVPKELRQIAKTVNFGLNYGMGIEKLAKTIGKTVQDTKALYDKYFLNLPNVQNLSKWAYDQCEKTEMVKTYFGRVRKLQWRDAPSKRVESIKNSAFNTMIQGTSADITKIAMLRVKDRVLDRFGDDLVQLKLQVHDELDFIVKTEHLDEICSAIKNAMTIPTPPEWVDFEVDCEVGPSWSEADHVDWEGEFVTDQFTGWGDLIPSRYQTYLTDPNYSATW